MQILYSSKFAREYRKLPNEIKDIAQQREGIFRNNPFNESLKTHKLKGKFKDFYSFSIGHKYRIIFEFSKDKQIAYFYFVGNHDIYQ